MSVQWTEDQKKVIELRNRNILVSAAAGSGKTAVLVERIIQRLLDERDPLDVDRLLIVTFTEAAAAEMKERIRDAIENALEDTPGNVHLQRQATLIHSARITTIHSFCLSVIREHFHAINLDPGFRIAEEGELKLLRQDVLEEMLESCYDEGTEAFLEFAEKFSTGRRDRQLEEVILQLYEYAGSYPQPEKWLNACVDNYQVENEHFSDAGFVQILIESIRQNLQGARILLNEALHICEESDGPYLYAEALEADLMMIETMEKAETFEAFYGKINQIAWKRLSAKKDETIDPEKKEAVKMLREKAKKMVKDLQETCFYETPEELAEDLRNTGSTMEELVFLVTTFARLFAEKKRSRNVIDFQDMEQFALQILTEENDAVIVNTPVYYPFLDAVKNNHRNLICSDLKNENGEYSIDFDDFEKKITDHQVKLFILCSPHNPAGRVWKKEELKQLFEICRAHQVYIISDEIHQDLVFGENKHIPSLSTGEYDDIMVSIVAASKTFNIAGAQNSMVIIPDEKLQEKWDAYVKGNRVLGGNAFGYVAAQAAYTGGNEWLTLVLDQIEENYQYLKAELAEKLPEAVVTPLEGTYLCWINLEAYVSADEMKEVIQKKCRLAVDFGDWFGGERFGTFIRMNLATSKENVEIGVNALIMNLMRK